MPVPKYPLTSKTINTITSKRRSLLINKLVNNLINKRRSNLLNRVSKPIATTPATASTAVIATTTAVPCC